MAGKTETLTTKVTPDEKEQIKELAAAQDETVSKYLYQIIFEKYIKEQKTNE